MTMTLGSRNAGDNTADTIGTLEGAIVNANDYDVLMFDWEGTLTSGINTVTAGDTVFINIDNAADITSNQYFNCTSVWELDYSTELTGSFID